MLEVPFKSQTFSNAPEQKFVQTLEYSLPTVKMLFWKFISNFALQITFSSAKEQNT